MPVFYPMHGPSIVDGASVPSTLELLRQPYVFSQSRLLTVWDFRDEAKKRGVPLDYEELELLDRRRVLVPFFRVHTREVAAGIRDRLPSGSASGEWQVFRAAREGRLSDPAARPFRPWPRQLQHPAIYYSRHQLLALRALPLVLTAIRRRRDGDHIVHELDRRRPARLSMHARDRALAICLEALAPRYLPRILNRISSSGESIDDLMRFIDDRDPRSEAAFLTIDDGRLLRQAEVLLSSAHQFDPMGSWHRVVRIAEPRRWGELRNDALIAQDYRLAAEVILLFLEDQANQGRSEHLSELSSTWRQPRHDRLKIDLRERAETVMDFGLSDRASVYLALEGQSEVVIARKVLDLAGFDHPTSKIGLVDLQGVRGDVDLLARAIAVPRIEPDRDGEARVLSPLTALIVVTDPEGRYSDAAGCSAVLAGMKRAVLESLSEPLRSQAMARDLDYLLHVRTWPAEFEFAHFSNSELAWAIRRTTDGHCPPEKDLRRRLSQCRQRGGVIKDIWKNWPSPSQPSKVRLAEILWPVLERRINNPRSRRPIPVVDVAEEAIRVLNEVRPARMMGGG